MSEFAPLEITQFIPSVALERTEPKNRFFPESADFDKVLDEVMNNFPDLRDQYIDEYQKYRLRSSRGDHTKPAFTDTFEQDVYHPILIAAKAIDEIRRFRIPLETYPQQFNNTLLEIVSYIKESQDISEEEISIQLIGKVIEVMQVSPEEQEAFIHSNNDIQTG